MNINELINENDSSTSIQNVFRVPKDIRSLTKIDIPLKFTELHIRNNDLIVNLKGCPSQIKNVVITHCSNLHSLIGLPRKMIDIGLLNIPLKNLRGSPEEVDKMTCGTVISANKYLKSLDGAPKIIHNKFIVGNAPNLEYHHVWETIHACSMFKQTGTMRPEVGVLGILRIRNIKSCGNTEQTCEQLRIVNNYLPIRSMSDIIRCKQELIDAGFKSNAVF